METPEPNRQAIAFLAMARKLRFACTQRDELTRRFRERYDRSENDLRLLPEKRAEIARAFLQASYRADHLYEEYLAEAVEQYRHSMEGSETGSAAPATDRRNPVHDSA